jgi:membrane associated rhomboid family serine protease
MDWSLVLASQGIDHVIEQAGDSGWALMVTQADHQAAVDAIHQYRVENAHWRWRRQVFQPGVVFDWSSGAWVLLNIIFYWWSETREDLRSLGMMDGAAFARGEWWRLFTATWLHADPGHLAMNAVFGLVFMGLVMGSYGPGAGLLAAYLAGAGGNVAAWLVSGEAHRGLGASGVVMGALGLLTVQSFSMLRHRDSNAFRLFTGTILAGVLLFLLLGLSPGVDVVAHLGGFVCGMAFGAGMTFIPRLANRPWVNLAAGILFAALVIIPWLRAAGWGN